MNPNGEKIVHIITQPPCKKKLSPSTSQNTSSNPTVTVPNLTVNEQNAKKTVSTSLDNKNQEEETLLIEKSQRVADSCKQIEHHLNSARDFIRQYHSHLTLADRKLVEDQMELQQSTLSNLELERTNLRLTIQSYLTGKRALLVLLKESFPNAEKIIPKLETQVQQLDRAFHSLE